MTDPSEIDTLIEQSSFGTPGASALRRRTPYRVARSIADQADRHRACRDRSVSRPSSTTQSSPLRPAAEPGEQYTNSSRVFDDPAEKETELPDPTARGRATAPTHEEVAKLVIRLRRLRAGSTAEIHESAPLTHAQLVQRIQARRKTIAQLHALLRDIHEGRAACSAGDHPKGRTDSERELDLAEWIAKELDDALSADLQGYGRWRENVNQQVGGRTEH